MDCKDNIDSLITPSSQSLPSSPSPPQTLGSSASGGGRTAERLPNMDKRKPLEKGAKDLMMDSDSQQQQQQQQQAFLNSTSSSSSSFEHTTTKAILPPTQKTLYVNKSFEASSSRGPRGRGGNRGIEAARQRFLLETAAKQQEANAALKVHKAIKTGNQTIEMSSKSSIPLLNRSDASNSSSSGSLTSQSSAQQNVTPQPVVLLPSQSLYTQNPTSFSNTANAFCNQSPTKCRPNSAFQHPRPQRMNDLSYPSPAMTGRNHRVQGDWAHGDYIYIKVFDLPDSATTRDLWTAFKHEGYIAHIRLYENARGCRDGKASIKFRYAWILVSVQAVVISDEVQSTTSQGFLVAKTLLDTGCRRSYHICWGASRH